MTYTQRALVIAAVALGVILLNAAFRGVVL